MTTEHDVQSATLVDTSARDDTLFFRNNSGLTPPFKDGSRVKYGLGNPGGSDLIGWRTYIITPEMVGMRFARFAALECKKPKGGVTSDDQKRFIALVLNAGGLAGKVLSVDGAFRILGLSRE